MNIAYLLQLLIHLLYMAFHAANLQLAGLDLTLELFNLKIEHELELF